MKEDILIVDDSHDMLEVLRRQLGDIGYRTFQASNVVDAIDVLKVNLPHLLITDIQMPGVDGMQLVRYVSEHYPHLPILVITGFPSVENAVDVLRRGAVDYLVKPFTKAELEVSVKKILINQPQAKTKNTEKKEGVVVQNLGFVGTAKALQNTIHLIQKTKDNKVTVLVTGESGTGKELVARAIHYSGKFHKSPFIAVNCGAIPEGLLESELFGYVKGAFTGANNMREGFFQAANGGTIFLDEIGNASLQVQQRLLRVIQEREIVMVGSQKPQKIDVRIIAATNNDLALMAEKGDFREDLYYRLNVVNIEVPPLRDRKEDIPHLTRYFIQKYAKELHYGGATISRNALDVLMAYNWPGNIRELENIIHRALVVADETIEVEHLPDSIKVREPKVKDESEGALKSLKEAELIHIKKVLRACNNNKTKAAEVLGITRKTLRQKLE